MPRALTPSCAAVLALVALACGGPPNAPPEGASTEALNKTPATPPIPPAGLMDRQGTPPGAPTEDYMTSSVVMLDWSDIQPTAASAFDWSNLDNQLASLKKVGVVHTRVRIMAGGSAPTWVKRLGGPASGYFNGVTKAIDCSKGADFGGVAVQNIQGPAACVPFFWTKDYLDRYEALMQSLASRLASDPEKYAAVSTIVDSACMAVYAEVFYRGQSDGPTNETLWEAGLTHPADIACQQRAIEIHADAFGASRRTSVAINDWDIVQGTPGPGDTYRTAVWYDGGTTWATYEFAEWARQELSFDGETLLEVQNNGLHSTGASCPADGTGETSYWCYIAQYSGRHGFQTQSYVSEPKTSTGASLTLLEDLDNGLTLHAQYIELPTGMNSADWDLMNCYNAHLLSGDPSPCPH
jgi:hypothetical protein